MQGPIACSQREEDAIDIQDLECLAEPTGFEITAIAAWNSFPRRPDYNDVDCAGCPERRRGYLTWTTEPPKDEGWYWCSDDEESDVYPIISYYDEWVIKEVLSKINDGKTRFKWAGPIAPPIG